MLQKVQTIRYLLLACCVWMGGVACHQETAPPVSSQLAADRPITARAEVRASSPRVKKSVTRPNVPGAVRGLPAPPRVPSVARRNDSAAPKTAAPRALPRVARRISAPVRWYRPTYRERRFRAPRVRLKKLPFVKPVKAVPWNHGSRKIRRIALTFDACSWNRRSRYDRRITDILIRTKTPATLFVGGKWVLEHRQETLRLAKFPFFEFANHTYLHGHLTRVSRARLVRELRWTQEIIYTTLGVIPALYRPPYFESNQRVVRVAAKLGLRSILGDLPSGDPNPKFTKRVMTRGVLRGARNGSIVVMHMNGGGHYTAEALPGIIRGLKRKGFQLVKVSTILGVPAYQTRN